MWLYLPFPAALLFQTLLSLSFSLPYCSASFIFPTSLNESASFFLLRLSFFPSPHHIISLQPWLYQCHEGLPPFVPRWHAVADRRKDSLARTSTLDEPFCVKGNCEGAALQCNESGHCVRGDGGLLGEGGTASDVWEGYEQAALLCLLVSTEPVCQYQVYWSANIELTFLCGLPPALKVKKSLKWVLKESADQRLNTTFLCGKSEAGTREGGLTGDGDEESDGGALLFQARWKGMLQWCHGCRREHASWWHNPHTAPSSTHPPRQPKILIKPSKPQDTTKSNSTTFQFVQPNIANIALNRIAQVF